MEELRKKILRVFLLNYDKIGWKGGIAKVIFDDRFEEMADEITAKIAQDLQPQWLSMDKAPQKKYILVLIDDDHRPVREAFVDGEYVHIDDIEVDQDGNIEYYELCHVDQAQGWQPLPQPPKQ